MVDLTKIMTEKRNERTMNLDSMSPLEIITIMNDEDERAVLAVKEVLPQIATAIQWTTQSLRDGGRLIYMGAGTSGRLGVLDAVECRPTFGVSPDVIIGIMAGGEKAFMKAVEGAEDSKTLGQEDLEKLNLKKNDIVIGIAASGRTPYVIHAIRYARKVGAKTVIIACNRNSEMSKEADLSIEPATGPEVLTGSTRLKAGSAQKMVLNMISTASMVGIGKVYQNLMVDVMQSNEKLVTRAQNIVIAATGCDKETAKRKIATADGSVKLAITMILMDCSLEQAKEHLKRSHGHIRQALEENINKEES